MGIRKVFDVRSRYKQDCVLLLKSQYRGPTITGAVALTFEFNMNIPKATNRMKRAEMIDGVIHDTRHFDLTNLVKLHEDALERAGILKNDSQVVECHARKFYSENPRTVITIMEL